MSLFGRSLLIAVIGLGL
jgi:putative membrane protein